MKMSETILLVDDNIDLLNGLREVLIAEGFMVLTANDGNEALEYMQITMPSLIISDISMPEMDGYAFFDSVRANPAWITIPFIFLTAHSEPANVLRARNLGADDFLIKPVSPTELVQAARSRLARFHQLKLAQLEQAYKSSLMLLANAIELRDQYTRGHIERVTEYAMIIGKAFGLNPQQLEILHLGSILHDIGKILVDPNIWTKASELTQEERMEVQQHAVRGADMINAIAYLTPATGAIRHHHERWDGTGYPDQLKGEAIPLEARIIAVADSFDAMTTTRPYHQANSLEEAYQEILRRAGSIYDPVIVEAFQRAWENERIQIVARKWKIFEENDPLDGALMQKDHMDSNS